MELQELALYGDHTVREYIHELHDMEIGVNPHYNEFSFTDYKIWKNKVIGYFRNNENYDASEIEDLFNVFESEYNEGAFTNLLVYLFEALDEVESEGCLRKEQKSSEDMIMTQNKLEQFIVDNQKSKVFIVHGHSELLIAQTESFIQRLGFEPIILRNQANQGKTIIEKLEYYTDVPFAIVLYTACDQGRLNDDSQPLKPRARQNVVFEHGYLNAKLGRNRVCALVEEGVEYPGDLSGVVYIPIDQNGAWKIKVANEMKAAGIDVDMNKVVL